MTFDSTISRSRSLPFARALAHAGENRKARACLGDVVDKFHHDDCLADAGAAKQTNLAAAHKRLKSSR